MSWSFNKSGKKQNIVIVDKHIPDPVRDAFNAIIQALPERNYNVESSGHIDAVSMYGSADLTLVIKPTEQV